MKFCILTELLSPEFLVVVIKPETVRMSLLNPLPVVELHEMLALVSSFKHVTGVLRVDIVELAPSDAVSNFGNDIAKVLPEATSEEYVTFTIISIVAPHLFVWPLATVIVAEVRLFGEGVNNAPELARVSTFVFPDVVSFKTAPNPDTGSVVDGFVILGMVIITINVLVPVIFNVTDLSVLLPVHVFTVYEVTEHPLMLPSVIVEYLSEGKVIFIIALDGIFPLEGWSPKLYVADASISSGLTDEIDNVKLWLKFIIKPNIIKMLTNLDQIYLNLMCFWQSLFVSIFSMLFQV